MKTFILAALVMTSSAMTQANEIVLSQKIKAPLKSKLERDLSILDGLSLTNTNPRTLQIMGVSNLNAPSASRWLSDRVKYVIEEDALSAMKLLFKKAIYVEQENVLFPDRTILPYSLNPNNKRSKLPVNDKNLTSKESESVTVMSNMSAALYMGGKYSNTLYGMKVSRGLFKKQIKVSIDSPRSGIIQIGEGLFNKHLTINNDNENAIANSLNRLATFFHEARHSDGNGASLAFAHSRCGVNHELAGEYACDESLNGPYAVGAFMTIEMIKSCEKDCSEREKETLKIIALDSAGRIMKTTRKGTPALDWDATPESL